jgi:sugar phosphate permease
MLSTVFDIGGVLGSVLLGYISDRFYKGKVMNCTSLALFCSSGAYILFLVTSSYGMTMNAFAMLVVGVTNCGSDTMITGPIAAQIGEQDGKNLQSATVGFVNGFGTVGAIAQGPLVGLLAAMFGWSGVFYAMIFLILLSGLCMTKAQRQQHYITT